MNNKLIVWGIMMLSLCFAFDVSAQALLPEYTLQASLRGSTSHALSTPSSWLMPYNVDDCFYDNIAAINKSSGQITYIPTPEDKYPTIHIYDIHQVENNGYICAGMSGANEDLLNLMNAIVYKMDSNGNVLWSTLFNWSDVDGRVDLLYPFQKMVVTTDGSIYAIAPGHYIAKVDAKGNKKWMKAFPNAMDIDLKQDTLLVANSNSINVLDTSRTIAHSYTFAHQLPFQKTFQTQDGGLYVLGNKNYDYRVYKFNPDLGLVDSMSYHGFSYGTDMEFLVYDSTYYLGSGDSLKSFRQDNTSNWEATLPSSTVISGLSYDSTNGQIAVTGTQGASRTNCPFIKIYRNDGTTDPIKRDIGIVNVIVSGMTNTQSPGTPDSLNIHDITANINVIVKNYGSETIDSLIIESMADDNFYTVPGGSCLENNIEIYKGLNLKTGDSAILSLGKINRFFIMPKKNGYLFTFEVNAASPNGKLDGNAANDVFNYSKVLSGIQEISYSKETDIKTYPNPFQSHFTIEKNSGGGAEYTITDITGKTICDFKTQDASSTIDLPYLPSGIYILKILGKNGISLQKIVKD